MLGTASLVLAGIVIVLSLILIVLVASWFVGQLRGGSEERSESYERHREAQARDPPVEIGDVHEAGVIDFSDHHSGDRQAVCKIQGFVVFVEDLPGDLEVGDVVRFRVLSFNRGHTSATGKFIERA
ncbi:TRAM domain-containing protein [Natronobacterium texcoconense]|nr:RNA-binding protein [Natronobacterium texcoconense]